MLWTPNPDKSCGTVVSCVPLSSIQIYPLQISNFSGKIISRFLCVSRLWFCHQCLVLNCEPQLLQTAEGSFRASDGQEVRGVRGRPEHAVQGSVRGAAADRAAPDVDWPHALVRQEGHVQALPHGCGMYLHKLHAFSLFPVVQECEASYRLQICFLLSKLRSGSPTCKSTCTHQNEVFSGLLRKFPCPPWWCSLSELANPLPETNIDVWWTTWMLLQEWKKVLCNTRTGADCLRVFSCLLATGRVSDTRAKHTLWRKIWC